MTDKSTRTAVNVFSKLLPQIKDFNGYSYHIPSFQTLPVFQSEKHTPPFLPFNKKPAFRSVKPAFRNLKPAFEQ